MSAGRKYSCHPPPPPRVPDPVAGHSLARPWAPCLWHRRGWRKADSAPTRGVLGWGRGGDGLHGRGWTAAWDPQQEHTGATPLLSTFSASGWAVHGVLWTSEILECSLAGHKEDPRGV